MKYLTKHFLLSILLATAWTLPVEAYDPNNRAEYLAKIKQAEAYYKEKCEKVASVKIYRTVPDVEGLLLMKVRPERTDRELADPMWPGAAFGEEYYGDSYLRSFLGYEYRGDGPLGSQRRGYINTDKRPGGLPGYRWVDVIDPQDGLRYRYTGRIDQPWLRDKRYGEWVREFVLDKTPSPSKPPPRYAVSYEDHVIPEERALWVASSTIKVLDLQTNEVLGEMTRYAISYIHAPRHSMPWLNHSICPYSIGGSGTNTRQFVDQILIPTKEK